MNRQCDKCLELIDEKDIISCEFHSSSKKHIVTKDGVIKDQVEDMNVCKICFEIFHRNCHLLGLAWTE